MEAENFLHNLNILILGAKGTRSCIRLHVMGVLVWGTSEAFYTYERDYFYLPRQRSR